jgi:hypothetical protein
VTLIEKIDALIAGLSKNDLERMPPLHRQRLAQALRRVADLADPPAPPPSGVLSELEDGRSRN